MKKNNLRRNVTMGLMGLAGAVYGFCAGVCSHSYYDPYVHNKFEGIEGIDNFILSKDTLQQLYSSDRMYKSRPWLFSGMVIGGVGGVALGSLLLRKKNSE
jgi:hypothetical protein